MCNARNINSVYSLNSQLMPMEVNVMTKISREIDIISKIRTVLGILKQNFSEVSIISPYFKWEETKLGGGGGWGTSQVQI